MLFPEDDWLNSFHSKLILAENLFFQFQKENCLKESVRNFLNCDDVALVEEHVRLYAIRYIDYRLGGPLCSIAFYPGDAKSFENEFRLDRYSNLELALGFQRLAATDLLAKDWDRGDNLSFLIPSCDLALLVSLRYIGNQEFCRVICSFYVRRARTFGGSCLVSIVDNKKNNICEASSSWYSQDRDFGYFLWVDCTDKKSPYSCKIPVENRFFWNVSFGCGVFLNFSKMKVQPSICITLDTFSRKINLVCPAQNIHDVIRFCNTFHEIFDPNDVGKAFKMLEWETGVVADYAQVRELFD